MHLDMMAAAEWAATMNTALISAGYAPVIAVGARLTDGDGLEFAVATAPGVTKDTVAETFRELLVADQTGKVRVRRIDFDRIDVVWEEGQPDN